MLYTDCPSTSVLLSVYEPWRFVTRQAFPGNEINYSKSSCLYQRATSITVKSLELPFVKLQLI